MNTSRFSSEQPTPPIHDPAQDDPLEIYADQYVYDLVPTKKTGDLLEFISRPTLKNARRVLKSYDIPEPLKRLVTKPKAPSKSTKQAAGDSSDTLHDLSGHPEAFKAVNDALKPSFTIDRHLKTLFMARSHAFTRGVFDYLGQKARMSLIPYILSSRDINRQLDTELYSRLRTSNSDNALHIVIDNVVALQPTIHTESQATIAYVTCAFLLCLLTNMLRLERTANTHIILYDGDFLRMDGTYVTRFNILFCKSIKRCTHASKVEVKNIVQSPEPKYFNRALDLHAYIANTQTSTSISIQDGQSLNTYDISHVASHTTNNVKYPHSKLEFCKYVQTATDKQRIRDLCHLNFLRDAYKADVALMNNALYITHDQLAFLYYKLIGGRRGLLISHGTIENYNYKVTI